jgi:uncharacterized membrane protein
VESKTKILGHPAHQMVVAFPIGLLATAALFDAVYVAGGGSMWAAVAFYMIGAGVVGGMVAAVFGLIDYLAIPSGTRAKRVGRVHGLSSVAGITLFAISWLLRMGAPDSPRVIALTFSFSAAAFLGLAGWLGGELLNRMGVGIDDGAHLNAPSSLSNTTALRAALSHPETARFDH